MNKLMKHIPSVQHIHARINGEGQWSAHIKRTFKF